MDCTGITSPNNPSPLSCFSWHIFKKVNMIITIIIIVVYVFGYTCYGEHVEEDNFVESGLPTSRLKWVPGWNSGYQVFVIR